MQNAFRNRSGASGMQAESIFLMQFYLHDKHLHDLQY